MKIESRLNRASNPYIRASCETRMWKGASTSRNVANRATGWPAAFRTNRYVTATVAVPMTTDRKRTANSLRPTSGIHRESNR